MQENSSLDCEKFTGRKRDICRGFDDDGNPVLTPEQCEAYRRLWAGQPQPEPRICRHRGPELRQEPCTLCGGREGTAPVFACALHGECADRRFVSPQQLPICYDCDDFSTETT